MSKSGDSRTVINPRGRTNAEIRWGFQCRLGRVLGRGSPDGDRVDGEERVRLVGGGLGAFGDGDRVLDRPGVQMQLLSEIFQDCVVGVVDVTPHQGVVGGQAVRDRRELEIVLRFAVAPDSASDAGHRIIIAAGRAPSVKPWLWRRPISRPGTLFRGGLSRA